MRLKSKNFTKEIIDSFDSKGQGGIDLHDLGRFLKETRQEKKQMQNAQAK